VGHYTNLASGVFRQKIPVTDKTCEGLSAAMIENERDLQPFNFIVTVAADGSVSHIDSSADTELAHCYRENFISRFPVPPFAPFHLQFWLFSKRGTADAYQQTV